MSLIRLSLPEEGPLYIGHIDTQLYARAFTGPGKAKPQACCDLCLASTHSMSFFGERERANLVVQLARFFYVYPQTGEATYRIFF